MICIERWFISFHKILKEIASIVIVSFTFLNHFIICLLYEVIIMQNNIETRALILEISMTTL